MTGLRRVDAHHQLARRDNAAVELSGPVTEADTAAWQIEHLRPSADTLLTAFGPDRVTFGSDWPLGLLAASSAAVVDAAQQLTVGLSGDEHAALVGASAARACGLAWA
jgi:L-fuconolactonase